MKLYWINEEERKKTRHEFDKDQKETIFTFCFLSAMVGAVAMTVLIATAEFLRDHLIWLWY